MSENSPGKTGFSRVFRTGYEDDPLSPGKRVAVHKKHPRALSCFSQFIYAIRNGNVHFIRLLKVRDTANSESGIRCAVHGRIIRTLLERAVAIVSRPRLTGSW